MLLASCVIYQHTATSRNGNLEKDTVASLGGTSSQKGADGSSFVHDHQASFQQTMQFLGSLTSAYFMGQTAKVKEITQQMQNANISQQQIAGINAQAAAAAAAEKSKLLLANPAAVKPAATILNAP